MPVDDDFDPSPSAQENGDTDPQIRLDRVALQDHARRMILLEQRQDELEGELRKLMKKVEKLLAP
jgi:hypothetical protein